MIALAVVPLFPYLRTQAAHAADGVPAAAPGAMPVARMPVARFLQLSQVLTNRPSLDPVIAARALECLNAEDAGFAGRAGALLDAINAAKFADMRQFKTFIAAHEALRPTAMKIISAWYLGQTGTPSGNSAQDDARFVSYAGALMYEPTKDATVVPSYSRGHTNYWAYPPKTIATD